MWKITYKWNNIGLSEIEKLVDAQELLLYTKWEKEGRLTIKIKETQ